MNDFLPVKTAELVELLGLIPHLEGGFFVETFRSGSTPMTTKGQTDWGVDPKKLVTTHDRNEIQEDKRRNALTSIFWVPTVKSPKLTFAINKSDHVHYYQGGKPFEYLIYHPDKKVLDRQILGPDLRAGHKLQVCVPGGAWKCGMMLVDYEAAPQEYTIIGEGVGPGFDFRDFGVGLEEDIKDFPEEIKTIVEPFLHANIHKSNEKELAVDFEGHYDEGDMRKERTEARS